jgi:NDP-sugar pyrophosphorylase family protein
MIIIPMAGKSSRFYNAGYTLPKFMLQLGKKTVFEEAVISFKRYFETDFFLFITRTNDGSKEFVTQKCQELKIKSFEIVSINYDTKGQADTISIGLENCKTVLADEEPIYIFNIDSIRVNFTKPTDVFLENTSGYLEVFKGEGDHWSFAEPLPNNYVKRTTEKIKISDLCSNGLYYFESLTLFKVAFKLLKLKNNYNELFVAPMYNLLLEKGLAVKYVLLDNNETLFSGTPDEYELLKVKLE